MRQLDRLSPTAAILLSTPLWGTMWIPLRQIEHLDLPGISGSWLAYLICLLIFLPVALRRGWRVWHDGWPVYAAGLSLALTFAFYSEGLIRGEVARVLLLFYLTPVWSTLLGRLMLNEAITAGRVAALVLGLGGLFVILGGDVGLPLPRDAADWMGLGAGVSWAFAMVYINKSAGQPMGDRHFVMFLFLVPVFWAVTLIPGSRETVAPTAAGGAGIYAWIVAFSIIWIIPAIWLTLTGASRLDPGRVAIILLLEIVIGLASAAALTDEPFGLREVLGGTLIMSAILAEMWGARRAQPAMAPCAPGRSDPP